MIFYVICVAVHGSVVGVFYTLATENFTIQAIFFLSMVKNSHGDFHVILGSA